MPGTRRSRSRRTRRRSRSRRSSRRARRAARGLAMSLTSLGEIRREGGDLAGAAAAHEESLATFRRILAAAPESASARRDAYVALDHVGKLAIEQAKPAAALAAFDEALPI